MAYKFKDKTAFYSTRLEEERAQDKRKVMTVSLSLEEYAQLQEDMRTIKQPKDSTALKQLWKVGRIVLHGSEMGEILKVIIGNSVRNERTGALLPEARSDANVTQNVEVK